MNSYLSQIENEKARVEAGGTLSLSIKPTTIGTALSILLLTSSSPHIIKASLPANIQFTRQEESGTIHSIDVSGVGSLDLFEAINSVYDKILNEQNPLDDDSFRVLHANRWDLYF